MYNFTFDGRVCQFLLMEIEQWSSVSLVSVTYFHYSFYLLNWRFQHFFEKSKTNKSQKGLIPLICGTYPFPHRKALQLLLCRGSWRHDAKLFKESIWRTCCTVFVENPTSRYSLWFNATPVRSGFTEGKGVYATAVVVDWTILININLFSAAWESKNIKRRT